MTSVEIDALAERLYETVNPTSPTTPQPGWGRFTWADSTPITKAFYRKMARAAADWFKETLTEKVLKG